jgi:hypothetical protein
MFKCAFAIMTGTLLLMQQPVAQTLLTIEDPEAYAVYAALFQRHVKHDPQRMRDIRLLQETRAGRWFRASTQARSPLGTPAQ